MSNTGGNDGDGNTPPSPEMTADDPQAALVRPEEAELDQNAGEDDNPPPQPPPAAEPTPGDGGTQGTSTTEQPQQGDNQGGDPVQSGLPGPPESQPPGSSSVRTPSPSGTEPATPSRGGFLSNLTRWVGGSSSGRGRRTSSATPSTPGNAPPRSNPSVTSGSRPVSLVEEPEPQTPERSGSQGAAGSSPGSGNAGSRATRADTGLSIATEVGDLEAFGENTPTPIGVRGRPNPFGPRSVDGGRGSLPNTPVDPRSDLGRRNRAVVSIFDQIRFRELTGDWDKWQRDHDNAERWEFQLGINALNEMADEGVASMRDVLATAGANVPAAIQTQIVEETRRRGLATRDRVNVALVDEMNFLDKTAENIVDLLGTPQDAQSRRRNISRASKASSLGSQASQPERPPMDPDRLIRNTREQLVDLVLSLNRGLQEAQDAVAELEQAARETQSQHDQETQRLRADGNNTRSKLERDIEELQKEADYFREIVEANPPGNPPRQNPLDQPPTRSSSEGSPRSVRSRSQTGLAPRSPAREKTFQDLTTLLDNLARHEALVRGLQEGAGLNPDVLDANTAPFSANSQLSRTQYLLQLREVTEDRDETKRNEDRLARQVEALEAARVSPPSRQGSGLFGNFFGGNRGRQPSNGDSRRGSGPREDSAAPDRNLADELGEQGSRRASDPPSSQPPPSRRQSEAGSRQSNASGGGSAGSRRQSGAGSRQSDAGSRQSDAGSRQSGLARSQSAGSGTQSNASSGGPDAVNPAPLRAIPEWLAAHPDGPCDDCVPTFRFPPELGELPSCGCICDLAVGNPRPSAGGSSGSGSSRSRASSGRSVRFADDGAAAGDGAAADDENGRRRPSPLDLSALGLDEENDADRPNTPYPADAQGGRADAPAPGEQAETVPIQAPEEEGPAVAEPAVGAPAIAAPVGGRDVRCPCCGRGTYGIPPAGGLPQVAFYTCRNMAGQPVPPRADAPLSLAEGLRNALAAAAAAAGLIRRGGNADAPAEPGRANIGGRGRVDSDPPAGPEPPVNVPVDDRGRRNTDPPPQTVPITPGTPGQRGRARSAPAVVVRNPAQPRDFVMTFLTLFWNFFSFFSFLQFRNFGTWLLSIMYKPIQFGLYLNLRYLAGQNVVRPIFARIPTVEARTFVLWCLVLVAVYVVTMVIALYEERRIWRAANAQLSAAYFRGLAFRRPYPFWAIFEADTGLLRPAFGRLSERLHNWYFGE